MFSPGVERALRIALEAHDGQFRKGSDDPYAVHPLHVALVLSRLGAEEEVVQAGLLHDVVEDSDSWTEGRVRAEFGDRVAGVVAEVTEDKAGTWAERKEHAIQHVPHLSTDALLVKVCDKLHNLWSLARSLDQADDTEHVWSKFTGGRERTLEMSGRLVTALADRVEDGLADELRSVLARIRAF